ALVPDQALPRLAEVSVDGRVLAFTLLVSLLCGLVFGLAPALKATDPDVHGALKDGGRGVSGGRHRAQDVLVVVQVAMVLVLLVGAGLMIRTLTRLWSADPGLDPRGVTTFGVALPTSVQKASPAAIRAQLRRLEQRLRRIPGVQAVSLSWAGLPMVNEDDRSFWVDGRPQPASSSEMKMALSYVVEPDYLRAMAIPLRAGRFFGSRDGEGGALVVVVDEVLARQYFGAENPVGRMIHLNEVEGVATIVGVVGHVKQWGLVADDSESLRAQIYAPLWQLPDSQMALTSGVDVVVRSRIGPPGLETLRAAVQEIDPEYVVSGVVTMDEAIAASLGTHRFAMFLLAVFAGVALLLATVGIYGVVSYAVGQRTAEIGIRVALGARRADVLRMILGQGMKMILVGVALGLAAALALTRLMAHLLYGVSATDPVTFAAVAAGLCGVALAACYLPARRAARVEPMTALRHE
ncbi:MAG TPA: FtsX-like permease family protein, partial [Kofleriaceae bacterium]|nr:FtsX-like permease family protein [Kofleriaceae bacterium]